MARVSLRLGIWGLILASLRHVGAVSDSQSTPEECIHPTPNTCNFYAQCLESRYHCGPSGYPIGFGQRFCEKSLVSRPKMSPSGQVWITDTMLCLQEQLVPFADGSQSSTCAELKQYALDTHAGCYVESGVCTLPISDWGKILEIVLPALVSDPENFKAAFATAKDCAKFYLWLIEKGIL